jgi:23S rRNA (uracil1939-C5)-methyltransferase
MARLTDGRVGFVAGALPGDVIRVEARREHKGHVEAERWSLLTPGTARIEPPCPVARQCGGCDWMALEPTAQREHKLSLLEQALSRTGGFRELPELELESAGPELGYRNRLRFQIGERGELGFFARGTNELVVVPGCLVADPALERAFQGLRSLAREFGAALGRFAAAELRVAPEPQRPSLRLEPRGSVDLLAPAQRLLQDELSARFDVSVTGREDAGVEQSFELPGGVTLRVPAAAFTQVNWAVNERLVADVVEGARSRSLTTFCDLYAGAGNFTLPLLSAGLRGTAVEGHAAALAAGRKSAERQGFTAEFVAEDVGRALTRLSRASRRFELVVLDPPRAGARDVLEKLVLVAARCIAYVACDPVTLARDLKWLAAHGFELEAIKAYDMFPQTHHFETLAWLRRVATP